MIENETKIISNFVIMIDFFINKCKNKQIELKLQQLISRDIFQPNEILSELL